MISPHVGVRVAAAIPQAVRTELRFATGTTAGKREAAHEVDESLATSRTSESKDALGNVDLVLLRATILCSHIRQALFLRFPAHAVRLESPICGQSLPRPQIEGESRCRQHTREVHMAVGAPTSRHRATDLAVAIVEVTPGLQTIPVNGTAYVAVGTLGAHVVDDIPAARESAACDGFQADRASGHSRAIKGDCPLDRRSTRCSGHGKHQLVSATNCAGATSECLAIVVKCKGQP
mmetsp:Transcript_50029/g.140257  ORF Transcript_50029/g.140257 Transcript_50029/m.140257 type:complete len:235 (-) Transcript_50029:14-718(-)